MNTRRKLYERDVAFYGERLRSSTTPDYLDVAGYAGALLCLGRLEEALKAFQLGNRLLEARVPCSGGYLEEIGAIHWILGNRGEAMSTWRRQCAGILDGTIRFADAAGGVQEGLLLWYGGLAQGDQESVAYAMRYLRNRARLKHHRKSWPGPLGLFVLGQLSFSDALLGAAPNTGNLADALRCAQRDILARREIAQATFYFGVYHRSLGDEAKCKEMMQLCASLENPRIEVEWYLARHELGLPILDDC